MYLNCKFQVAPVIIGTTDYVENVLLIMFENDWFNEKESKPLICEIKIKSISGTGKICRSFLSFSDPF